MYFIWRKTQACESTESIFWLASLMINLNPNERRYTGVMSNKNKTEIVHYSFFCFRSLSYVLKCFFCASFENENNKKYIRLWSVSAFELYLPTSCDKLFDVVQKMFHVQCRFCTHRKYIRSFRFGILYEIISCVNCIQVSRIQVNCSECGCVWMWKCFVSEMAGNVIFVWRI